LQEHYERMRRPLSPCGHSRLDVSRVATAQARDGVPAGRARFACTREDRANFRAHQQRRLLRGTPMRNIRRFSIRIFHEVVRPAPRHFA